MNRAATDRTLSEFFRAAVRPAVKAGKVSAAVLRAAGGPVRRPGDLAGPSEEAGPPLLAPYYRPLQQRAADRRLQLGQGER